MVCSSRGKGWPCVQFELDEVDQATINSKSIQSPIMTCCLRYDIFHTIRSLLTADQAKKRYIHIFGEVRDTYIYVCRFHDFIQEPC